jgi:hypothetical protein
MKKIRRPEKSLHLACAWYRKEQWAMLRAASIDRDELEESYEKWLFEAEQHFRNYRAAGIDIVKVDIDVGALLDWCREENQPLSGEARARFACKTFEDIQGKSK